MRINLSIVRINSKTKSTRKSLSESRQVKINLSKQRKARECIEKISLLKMK
jgi:hypothetical protein